MKAQVLALAAALALPSPSLAKGSAPEDLLQGQIIFSDKSLPTSWKSVGSYVQQLRALNRTTLWYDKKTGKAQVSYAAFFARPLNDVQVDLVIYDITGGRRERKSSNEQFMQRGDRVLINSLTLDKEDLEMNRKYLVTIESRRVVLAKGEFILRGETEKYSGKVTFSEDEAKAKDKQ